MWHQERNEFAEIRPGSLNSRQIYIYTLTMLHFTFTRNKHNVHKICMEINREEQRHIPLSLSTEVPACHSMQMHTQSF